MSSHPKSWYFSVEDVDGTQQVYIRYEDRSPLVNPSTKLPFGCVYDLHPGSTDALPHAIEVSLKTFIVVHMRLYYTIKHR